MSISDTLTRWSCSLKEQDKGDVIAERSKAIRGWCQGEGLLAEGSSIRVTDEELVLFEVPDKPALIALLKQALQLIPNALRRNALSVALAEQGPKKSQTLTERRAYYAEAYGFSPRTTIRHEQEAANQVAELIDKIKTIPEPASPLEQRVRDLEILVYTLLKTQHAELHDRRSYEDFIDPKDNSYGLFLDADKRLSQVVDKLVYSPIEATPSIQYEEDQDQTSTAYTEENPDR